MKYLEVKPRWNPITDSIDPKMSQDYKNKNKDNSYHSIEPMSVPHKKPSRY